MWPFNHTRPSALSMTCNPPSATMTRTYFLHGHITYLYVRTNIPAQNVPRGTLYVQSSVTQNPGESRPRLFFDRLNIQALPQIPASNRAIRSPRFRDLQHRRRLGPLAFLVVLRSEEHT